MKKVSIIILVLSIFGCSSNQLFQGYEMPMKSNILYQNIFHIVKLNLKSNKPFNVYTDKGSVTKLENDLIEIYTDTIKIKGLNLFVEQGNRTDSVYFRVKPIPDVFPVIKVEGKNIRNPTIISANDFRKFHFLSFELYNFDHNCGFRLNSYRISRFSDGELKRTSLITKPHSLPNSEIYLTGDAKSGDVYLFSEIEFSITGSSSQNKDGNAMKKKVKDFIVYIN